jgi:hypothetical protein
MITLTGKCQCGHTQPIPDSARVSDDPWMGGIYFECKGILLNGQVCNSTIFIPARKKAA